MNQNLYHRSTHINQSPLANVGLPIRLREFTKDQIKYLAELHGLFWGANQVDQLFGLIGGHPYLVRVALYYIAHGEMSLEKFIQQAPTEEGKFSDHLRRLLWKLEQYKPLGNAIRRILGDTNAIQIDSVIAFKLEGLGLVVIKGTKVILSNELYRQYFLQRL